MGKKVNKKELAEIVGVAQRTLTDWQKKGMPMLVDSGRGKANEYDTADVIAWRVEFVVGGEAGESAKERKERLEGNLLELKLAKEAALLISREDIEPIWEGAVVAARSEFLSSAKKLKTKIKKEYGVNVGIELLIEHGDAALARLAEYTPDSDSDAETNVVEMGAATAA